MRILTLAMIGGLSLCHATALAQSHSGTLESGDETRSDSGQYTDSYDFDAEEGQQVTVNMSSDAFDTYLIVESPSGTRTENDDAGSTSESRVELIADAGGTWRAIATSYSSGDTGDYTVAIELGGLADVEVVEGRLDNRDTVTIKGEYYDTHTVSVTPGAQIFIELASLGFDGFLSVTTPGGQIHRNDDAGSTELSRVGPLSGEAGEYTVYATSVNADEVGAYDLRIVTLE